MSQESSKKEELEEIKALAEEYLSGWKRAKADLINFQKEVEKQREDWIKFANAGFVLSILPIYESVERLVEQIGEAYLEGVRNIKKQFDDFLKNIGVEKIKTIGEKFDPDLHESVGVKKEEGKESDMILEEAQAGYTLNGEVLRAAKVVISESE